MAKKTKTKVRRHERITPSGKKVTVKSHYRKVPASDFKGIEGEIKQDLKQPPKSILVQPGEKRLLLDTLIESNQDIDTVRNYLEGMRMHFKDQEDKNRVDAILKLLNDAEPRVDELIQIISHHEYTAELRQKYPINL